MSSFGAKHHSISHLILLAQLQETLRSNLTIQLKNLITSGAWVLYFSWRQCIHSSCFEMSTFTCSYSQLNFWRELSSTSGIFICLRVFIRSQTMRILTSSSRFSGKGKRKGLQRRKRKSKTDLKVILTLNYLPQTHTIACFFLYFSWQNSVKVECVRAVIFV